MELIQLTRENLEQEHICCAISNNKDIQVSSKKAWLADRLEEGLVFLKGNVRGKCFIEYLPAENAWAPIKAEGYMYIDCLWVSGQFKGQGNSSLLMDACIADSREKGKKGLVVLSSKKKLGFLSDPKYLKYRGFRCCDTAAPYFELWYLPFTPDAEPPAFVQNPVEEGSGFVLYYTNQCPFTAKYVPVIENMAKERGIPFRVVHIATRQAAQSAPCPFTTYALYWNGSFVTHEILSEKKFEKILAEYCKEI